LAIRSGTEIFRPAGGEERPVIFYQFKNVQFIMMIPAYVVVVNLFFPATDDLYRVLPLLPPSKARLPVRPSGLP
jgi:hypothetical protein